MIGQFENGDYLQDLAIRFSVLGNRLTDLPISFSDQKKLNNAYLQELTNGLKKQDSWQKKI